METPFHDGCERISGAYGEFKMEIANNVGQQSQLARKQLNKDVGFNKRSTAPIWILCLYVLHVQYIHMNLCHEFSYDTYSFTCARVSFAMMDEELYLKLSSSHHL